MTQKLNRPLMLITSAAACINKILEAKHAGAVPAGVVRRLVLSSAELANLEALANVQPALKRLAETLGTSEDGKTYTFPSETARQEFLRGTLELNFATYAVYDRGYTEAELSDAAMVAGLSIAEIGFLTMCLTGGIDFTDDIF